ncbi:MAG: alpha/beta hydrolase [Acidimicrobiia bacterium]|nr:alpha/beta hydrolase [Acidimicrobiia bacterium]
MELKFRGEAVRATTGGRPINTELPLVVFLHGASQDRTLWALQQRWFSHHGWSVLAPDLPGHGLSGGKPIESIEDLADWVADFIAQAGFTSAAIVGHSMGALIGLELAGTRPDLVTKLVLSGAASALPVGEVLQNPADANERKAHEMVLGWTLAPQSAKGGHPTPGLWMSGVLLHTSLNNDDDVLATGLRACNVYDQGPDRAAEVSCPVLVMSGADDRMVDQKLTANLVGALAAHGTHVVIEGAGHAAMVEQPDEVLDTLIRFLTA